MLDDFEIPGVDENAYALEVTGSAMLPVYREGDILIVSPNAELREGNRVVVKMKDGAVMARKFDADTPDAVTFSPFNLEAQPSTIEKADIDWMARIIWASQ